MDTTRKIALGVGGTLIVIAAGFGIVTQASAEPTPSPSPSASAWQRGYGAARHADDLAGKLGVSADAVSAALEKYHLTDDGAPMRGRDATDEQRAARKASMAAFLAKELNLTEAKVLDALDGWCDNAGMGGRMGDGTGRMGDGTGRMGDGTGRGFGPGPRR